jgi:hypothetical protein
MIILDRLPFFSERADVVVAGARVKIRPYQIAFWVSLSRKEEFELHSGAPRFPVILDTGNNHNFSIHEKHLEDWSGLDVDTLSRHGWISLSDEKLPLLGANVWIYQNVPKTRDHLKETSPVRLAIPEGMAVYPARSKKAPRLPTLGLRCLVSNRLLFTLDGPKTQVSLLSLT